ncbi:MAG: MarR family transcriptional regulator [Hyphomonadaceae bacterium]|nr:MarR family transcriptional regulator [Hyphomonadaceae bacterium]
MANPRDTVRLSIRLLATARLIEREADALMRAQFKSTIARFDVLSALDRHGALSLGEISQNLLVSNGNVTQLMARLKSEGLVDVRPDVRDRRIQRVRLTARGERLFSRMAEAHAALIQRLLGELSDLEKQALVRHLDSARATIRSNLAKGATP